MGNPSQHFGRWLVAAFVLATTSACAQVIDSDDKDTLRALVRPRKPAQQADVGAVVQRIVELTNDFRRSEKLPPVESEVELTKAATYFAEFMAKEDKYGHTADGQTPAERAKQHGYRYCLVLENIAYQYSSLGFGTKELADRFAEGWKNSPKHRKNMLDPDVMDTGVAVAQSEETGHYYAVQMFGRPRSKAIEFKIANHSETTVEYKLGEDTFTLPPRFIRTHERCRPPELIFDWPGDKSRTVRPASADEYVVTGDKESLRLQKK